MLPSKYCCSRCSRCRQQLLLLLVLLLLLLLLGCPDLSAQRALDKFAAEQKGLYEVASPTEMLQTSGEWPEDQRCQRQDPGLLLRNLNSVTILGKPYYLLYMPIMVTETLNPEPYITPL